MRVRMLGQISGHFVTDNGKDENGETKDPTYTEWPPRGGEIDLPDVQAKDLIRQEMAELVEGEVESAAIDDKPKSRRS